MSAAAGHGWVHKSLRAIWRFWDSSIEVLSFEFFLTRLKRSNGGSIIILRTVLTTTWLFLVILILRNLLDPERTGVFSMEEFRVQLIEIGPWFGGIFAGTYTALYARFASQWTYLANLYNQIKAVEARKGPSTGAADGSNRPLQSWKAGFIEDADSLHLATKPLFASVVNAWAQEEGVIQEFDKNTPGGKERLDAIKARVEIVCERAEMTR